MEKHASEALGKPAKMENRQLILTCPRAKRPVFNPESSKNPPSISVSPASRFVQRVPNYNFFPQIETVTFGKEYRLRVTPKTTNTPSKASIILITDYPEDKPREIDIKAEIN